MRSLVVAMLCAAWLPAQEMGPATPPSNLNPAAAMPSAPPFMTCPAGAPLGAVDLQVEAGGQRLPFRSINRLSEGDSVLYAPVLRGKEKRTGEIALVLVPERRQSGQPTIIVTEPKPADRAGQWQMPQTIALAAVVYGPSGLSRRKVVNFLSQDDVLIAQLADYADKTAQAEQLVATLSNAESSSAAVNAALNGFASQYGFSVQVDRSAPAAAQAATVFGAMNPQLASYNPLASTAAQGVGQATSLASVAGTLFFGTPVGLAAGGTAMLLDLRYIAFPDTQFRASFVQQLTGSPSGVNVCGQQGPAPPHTRVAYIWASRIPNVPAPPIKIGEENYIPAAQKTPVPVDVPEAGWKYVDRIREWALVNGGHKAVVPVVKLGNQKSLEIDLTKANLPPGDFRLAGLWDWTPVQTAGIVHVLPLSDFRTAHLDPVSQDRLLAKSGKLAVTVKGGDFEFTTKVEVQKLQDEFATPENARFLLPKGLRKGPQEQMDVQIDTQNLDPGGYKLLITQQDGVSHAVEFKILRNPPKIDNWPILVNHGGTKQHYILKGERLEQVSKLEAPGAELSLGPARANQSERSLTVELRTPPHPGTAVPVTVYLEDRSEPLTYPGALEITGPLPVIASSRLSWPKGMAVTVRSDEFPAGYTLNAVLDVKNIERQSVLHLACADGVGQPAVLHIGEQTATWNLEQLSPDQLFLALDTSGFPAACSLEAVIDNGREGRSQPFTLAHILRVPQIDSLVTSDTPPQDDTREYRLTGENLEMIEKLGWDAGNGADVIGLPVPLPGPGLRQSIQVNLPDPPAPDAVLYAWLRGDKTGRATDVKAPEAAPAPPAAGNPPVAPVATAVTVSTSPNPSTAGHAVTIKATVLSSSGGGIPTGAVSFFVGDTVAGTGTLDANGVAAFTLPAPAAGKVKIRAVYAGSAAFAGSTSAVVTHIAR
ncbi:MAG TPA: Ig-like domain-containing protein [Bryobacteraceae bacterium]|nr:Ig-like domain-containing protein [Bryobacteraceae bacterium]